MIVLISRIWQPTIGTPAKAGGIEIATRKLKAEGGELGFATGYGGDPDGNIVIAIYCKLGQNLVLNNSRAIKRLLFFHAFKKMVMKWKTALVSR